MKYFLISIMAVFLAFMVQCASGDSTTQVKKPSGGGSILSEEKAIIKIAAGISANGDKLKGKKIGVFNFSNLEGKETKEGIRISKKLMEKLVNQENLTLVERTEIEKILKAKEIEMTGIVDTESIDEGVKILPIDVMITGTIAQIGSHGELSVKAVNISNGEIISMLTVEFLPREKFSYKENKEKLDLHRKNPDKIVIINKTYQTLIWLSRNKPGIFLLAVSDKGDPMLENKPKLKQVLYRSAIRIKKNNPKGWRGLIQIRKGVKVLKKHDPQRYSVIVKKKQNIIRKTR
jgi:hypothetical protein